MTLCDAPCFGGMPRAETLLRPGCNYRAIYVLTLDGTGAAYVCGVHLRPLLRALGAPLAATKRRVAGGLPVTLWATAEPPAVGLSPLFAA